MPPQLVTIPLGGRDYAGQPLPQQASYLVAGAGASEGLPGDPYRPPAGEPQADGLPGDPFQPSQAGLPPSKREVSIPEAILGGVAHGATFGAAPAIAGLAAASGMQAPQDVSTAQPEPGQLEAGQALARPFVGLYNLLTGSGGEAYSKAREQALKDYEEIKSQRPYVSLGGELAGGLAALPATPFTGLGAATRLGRIAQGVKVGGVTGGLTGAGEATGRGESPTEIGKQAGVGAASGAVLGAGLGGAIEGVAGTASKIASLRRGQVDPELEAAKKVQEMFRGPGQAALERTLADRPALRAGSETGAPLTVGDFGGRPAAGLLRAATDISPEARELADAQLNARYRQQAPRVIEWIQSKFGGRDVAGINETLQDQARKQNAPAYRLAYAAGDRPIWSPELERLTAAPYVQRALRGAISKWKNFQVRDGYGAANPPFQVTADGQFISTGGRGMKVYPNIQMWDYAARELQDAARARPGTQQSLLFNDLARALKNELDGMVPEYQIAREGAARFFGARDALEAGKNFVSTTAIGDGEAIRALKKMSPAERTLFSRGFSGELAERLGARNYSADIINNMYINSPRAQRRISIALGPDAAAQFEAVLRIESIMDKTRRAIGGSQTSTNLQGLPLIGGLIGGGAELIHSLNPAYVIAGALTLGGREAARKIDEQVALKVAEMLLSNNPASINRGYDVVSRNPVLREALRRASDLGVRELISRAGVYNVGAGIATVGGRMIGGAAKPTEETPHRYYQQEEEQRTPAQLK